MADGLSRVAEGKPAAGADWRQRVGYDVKVISRMVEEVPRPDGRPSEARAGELVEAGFGVP